MTSTWFGRLTDAQFRKLDKEINAQEFDQVFQITEGGVLDGPAGIYAPESVENDSEHDILVDGVPKRGLTSTGWQALEGYTGQYGYDGAVMHDSEFIGGHLANDMIEMSATYEAEGTPLLWTKVLASYEEEGEDEIQYEGWVILYRKIGH